MAVTLPPSSGTCKSLILFQQRFYLSYSLWKISVKVVACAVFLSLGFAFYVFFAPFVGNKTYQYIVVGLYSPLVTHLPISLCLFRCVIFSFSASKLVCEMSEICDFVWSQILVFGFFCKSEFRLSFQVVLYHMIYQSVKIVV